MSWKEHLNHSIYSYARMKDKTRTYFPDQEDSRYPGEYSLLELKGYTVLDRGQW